MSRLRQLSREEKEALVLRLEAGERVAAVAAETGGASQVAVRMAGRLAGVGSCGLEPQTRSQARRARGG